MKKILSDKETILKLTELLTNLNVDNSYKVLEQIGDIKRNYGDYLITEPINCEEELKRLENADFELCSALFTMLLREDHFCNGAFSQRVAAGQVEPIVLRMIRLIEG